MSVAPPTAYEIQVTGTMWNWSFSYPNGYVSNELHVPKDVPILLVLQSPDVIHSLFIPAFRVKKDAVPGRYNRFWFQATETGEFDIYCTEYCGNNHSTMLNSVVVHTKEDFKNWLKEAAIWEGKISPIEAGEKFYKSRGCNTCHSIDGTIIVGPTFKDLYNNQVPITGQGTIKADENYIRESILYPQAKVHQGFGPPSPMPSFLGQLNDEDIGAIIAYMRSISSHNVGDLAEFKVVKPRGGGKPTTAPSATQPAGSVPRQEFNTRAPGQQPKVDPNAENKNPSQKK